ncbi:MAG: alpha/beta fold hydrolase, partial [Oscillospiraceae bacterium]|nr:alpha/beta fold hydrolase [Oscillospiraceae bacterium]
MELNYTQCGHGAPLVLLHGNGEDSTYFEHQIEEFSNEFTVFAVDSRGHGKSPMGSAPFT